MRDSSARMSSYCRSRYPTISEKLRGSSTIRLKLGQDDGNEPSVIIDLITKTRRINDGERDTGSFFIEF